MSSLTRFPSALWKRANDALLGIDTVTVPATVTSSGNQSVFADSYAYSSPDYADLRRVIARLSLCRSDVVYDFGCGLGRFVCLAARCRVAKVFGIEINRALLERCRQNAASLKGRKAPIELRVEDASQTAVGDGTVFFFFNPFGPATFGAVLANVERSLAANRRKCQLVYVNPQPGHKALLAEAEFLQPQFALRSLRGLEILFFREQYRHCSRSAHVY